MIVEVLAVLAIVGGGSAISWAAGLRGWGAAPFGAIVGISSFVTVGTVQVTTRLPTTPIFGIVVTALAGAIALVARLRRSREWYTTRTAIGALTLAGSLVCIVAVVRATNVVTWHVDSLVYAQAGRLLADDHFTRTADGYLLSKRLLAVPYLHSPSAYADEWTLASWSPIVGLACAGIVAWFIVRGLERSASRATVAAVATAAVAFLATMSRFWWHATYVNGHLVVGAAFVAIAGACWLIALGRGPVLGLLVVVAAVPTLLVVTRPEGALFAAIAVGPFAFDTSLPAPRRSLALTAVGIPTLVYHLHAVERIKAQGAPSEPSFMIMIAFGIALLLAACLVRLMPTSQALGRLPIVGELIVWCALAAAALRSGTTEVDRALSTLNWSLSPVDGYLGRTFILLAVAGLAAGLVLTFEGAAQLRYGITLFAPLMILLSYVRGDPYRISPVDSLNRMLIQVLPILVVYVAVSLSIGRPHWRGGQELFPRPECRRATTVVDTAIRRSRNAP